MLLGERGESHAAAAAGGRNKKALGEQIDMRPPTLCF
jgi:hypothetical protein